MSIGARFEFPAARFELHFTLGNEVRRDNIPAADHRRAQQFVPAFLHKQDSSARRSEHPFLSASAGEIHILQRDWKDTHGLDGIDREQNAALRAKRPDRFEIDAIAAAIVRTGERDEFGPLGQRALDNFGCNFTDARRLEEHRLHAEPLEREPGINVRRVIVEVADYLVPRRPIEAVRHGVQSARRRTRECDLVRLTLEQLGHQRPRFLDPL